MPRGDRTGPEGKGPMTGWGNGDCAKRVDKETNVSDIRPAQSGRFGWWKNHQQMRVSNGLSQQENASTENRFLGRVMRRGFRRGSIRS